MAIHSPTLTRRLVPLLGLAALAAAWVGTLCVAEPRLAHDLEAGALATVAGGGDAEPWLRVEVAGRDLVARGEAPAEAERSRALDRLADVPGARRVVDRTGIIAASAPFAWTARRRAADRIDLRGDRPAELGRDALAARLRAALPDGIAVRDDARAARGAAPAFPERAAYALGLLARLVPGGAVTLTDDVLDLHGETADLDDDARLRAALANPLPGLSLGRVAVEPPVVRPFSWSLAREPDGGLAVAGYVASEADRRAILKVLAADGAPVRDGARPGRGLDAAIAPRALAESALAAVTLLREGRVSLEGTRLGVRGEAVDAQAAAEIAALVSRGLPAGLAAGEVAVSTHPPSPYRTSLRRTAGAVTLAGHLPDATLREDLVAILRPSLFGDRILDRTRLAPGAPPDLARALAVGAGALATLAAGEVVAEDRTLRLSGESLYAEAAARLRVELPRQVPPGWTAQVALTVPGLVPALDPEVCRARFAVEVAPRPLRFPAGGTDPTPDFYPVLDALAALVRSCPAARVAVAGHRDPPGAAATEGADRAGPAGSVREKPVSEKPVPEKSIAAKPAPASDKAKPAARGAAVAKTSEKASETTGAVPDPGLAGRRAQAVVDYLLKAGVAAERIDVLPEPARDAVGLELRP